MFKKIILCLLFAAANIFSISPYDEIRKDFKLKLYNAQMGLINDKQVYFKIIEKFLVQAENTLEVCRYFKQRKDDAQFFKEAIVGQYLNNLLIATVNMFNLRNTLYIQYARSWGIVLEDSVQKIKDQYKLEFDVTDETIATFRLLNKANQEYYRNIAFYKRWWLNYPAFFYCL